MAELDPGTAGALCRSLEIALAAELGCSVVCTDISSRTERWDIEARDERGQLLRRVSHTQTVPTKMAMAGAELRDICDALEAELAALGISGQGISLHGRHFPNSGRERQQLGRNLARRIRDHVQQGVPIMEDWKAVLHRGQHPWKVDAIARAFASVGVFPRPAGSPSKVAVSGDDRMGYRVPELHEEALPAIAEKATRHKELTPDLTLVVEPVLADITADAAGDLANRLELHQGFKSIYVGKYAKAAFPLHRVH